MFDFVKHFERFIVKHDHFQADYCFLIFRNASNFFRNASTFLRNLKNFRNSTTIKLCTGQFRPQQINQMEVHLMKQTSKNQTRDICDIIGRVAAKYFQEKGVIEIKRGKYIIRIFIPPNTPIEVVSMLLDK